MSGQRKFWQISFSLPCTSSCQGCWSSHNLTRKSLYVFECHKKRQIKSRKLTGFTNSFVTTVFSISAFFFARAFAWPCTGLVQTSRSFLTNFFLFLIRTVRVGNAGNYIVWKCENILYKFWSLLFGFSFFLHLLSDEQNSFGLHSSVQVVFSWQVFWPSGVAFLQNRWVSR